MPSPRHAAPLRRTLAVLFAVVLLAASSSARAQAWSETGDAGDQLATAQVTLGSGALASITGTLQFDADVDLYCIHLTSVPPAGLPLVQLQCVINQGPNVWLFDAAGNGVFTNETCSAGSKTLVAPNVSLPAGTYYVGVSYYGMQAQSAGGSIWNLGVPGQRTPDGPGAAGALSGWTGAAVVGPQNPYTLYLSGMSYCGGVVPVGQRTWGTLKSHYR